MTDKCDAWDFDPKNKPKPEPTWLELFARLEAAKAVTFRHAPYTRPVKKAKKDKK